MSALMTRHFMDRVEQRYGLQITEGDAQRIIALILKGFGKFLGIDIDGCERYLVGLRGRVFDVIYCPSDNTLVTAYPDATPRCATALRCKLSDVLQLSPLGLGN